VSTPVASGRRHDASELDKPFRHIGHSSARSEDLALVNGRGRYLADLPHAGAYELAFVRSTLAHGRIIEITTDDASRAPGVLAVVTGRDLATLPPIPVIWRQEGLLVPDFPALATDVVHYVGQPVAAVVARSREEAEDAADLVEVDYVELPAVTDAREALEDGAPILHSSLGTNEAYRTELRAGPVDEIFRDAETVVEAEFEIQRQTALPMEGRGILVRADDGAGGITVWATVQHPHLYRDELADMFGIPHDQVRVIVPDLGGAFGAYYQVYPEDVVALWVARHHGVDIRWLEDRQESFLSTVHARQQHHAASMALTAEGRILAVRDRITADLGAFIDYSGAGPCLLTGLYLTGPYDIQAVDIVVQGALTNKVRAGAYRGFGQPEAVFVMDRLVDIAAHRLGLDPVDLRRRNIIHPDKFPYQLASGPVMDSANLPGLLDMLVGAAGYDEIRHRQAEARSAGSSTRIGVGLGLYTEYTGSGPSRALGGRGYRSPGWECVTLDIQRDGRIRALSGVSHLGQGARTVVAQIAAEHLGVSPADVTVVTGDTGQVRHGNRGSVGSRSAVIAGEAMNRAATELAQRIRELAADLLEADPGDIVLDGGRATVAGSGDAGLSFAELGNQAYLQHRSSANTQPALEVTTSFDPSDSPFASGAHLAVVEVDTETGVVTVLRYLVAHDCGTVINPAIVEGQVLGGTVQGLGGALLEELVYDEAGQLRTGSMMDYLTPTVGEVPDIEILHQVTPTPLNPLGVKGAGEAGTIAPAAALSNAVSDALGVEVHVLPMSPARVCELVSRPIATGESR
jgi:carbon-monoxide dehydrogenase large subunit